MTYSLRSFLAVLLELERAEALIAINKKHTICSLNTPLCMGIKILQLLKIKFRCHLAAQEL